MIFSSDTNIDWDNTKIAIIKPINSVEDLFNELYNKLPLPSYFGYNWNALDECLSDLHWIKEKRLIILHEEKLNIPQSDLDVYLDVLKVAVENWTNNNIHELIVFIPI
jgi:RNAse (barnase) inhibitor barstar